MSDQDQGFPQNDIENAAQVKLPVEMRGNLILLKRACHILFVQLFFNANILCLQCIVSMRERLNFHQSFGIHG